MNDSRQKPARWQQMQVTNPLLLEPVSVIAARGISYVDGGNRLQTLNLYLPATQDNLKLIGMSASNLPLLAAERRGPGYQVHIHGGAWRDPHLSANSIEPQVALAFQEPTQSPLVAICSINYTLAKFPNHPDDPYDPELDCQADPAREGVHPQQVADTMRSLVFLRSIGLEDHSYILTCHSCGSCIAFQSILQPPSFYGLSDAYTPPCPAAIVSLNGLYDLPALVNEQDVGHKHLGADYRTMIGNVFGDDEESWALFSPTRFDSEVLTSRVQVGRIPSLLLVASSDLDQLVPRNQVDKMEQSLRNIKGVDVIRGTHSVGYHAMPWETGTGFWQSIQDAFTFLDH